MSAGPLCPRFHQAIELIGGRWTGAILHQLLAGKTRFIELRNAIPEISDRMLAERLRALEDEGLVVRRVIPETPVRIDYGLTDKGHELQASLQAVARWAERWLPQTVATGRPAGDAPAPVVARRRASSPGARRPSTRRRVRTH